MKQDLSGLTDLITGRLYVAGNCNIPNGLNSNPGVIAYHPENWIELWLKLGRCELVNPEILEEYLVISKDETM